MTDPTPELLGACFELARNYWSKFPAASTYYAVNVETLAKNLAAFVQAREQAAAQRAIEEHEAEICPEDYGCEEYIAYLKKREQAARLDEAKWWHGRKGTCPSATSDECCRRIAALAEHKPDSESWKAEPKEPRE